MKAIKVNKDAEQDTDKHPLPQPGIEPAQDSLGGSNRQVEQVEQVEPLPIRSQLEPAAGWLSRDLVDNSPARCGWNSTSPPPPPPRLLLFLLSLDPTHHNSGLATSQRSTLSLILDQPVLWCVSRYATADLLAGSSSVLSLARPLSLFHSQAKRFPPSHGRIDISCKIGDPCLSHTSQFQARPFRRPF
ncbi:hypothetical protein MKX08_005057 [Trichoderma sp. CBMAI-0020]|nr:hypothetical protein MKX08_005057 [Trichoderma sp. CBMAI-0020]